MFLPPETFRPDYISQTLFELLFAPFPRVPWESRSPTEKEREGSKEVQCWHFTCAPCPQPRGKYRTVSYKSMRNKNIPSLAAKILLSIRIVELKSKLFEQHFLHLSASFPTSSIFCSLPSILLFPLLPISYLVFPIIPPHLPLNK